MRANIVIGIPFYKLSGVKVPLRSFALRFNYKKIGDFIFDGIQDYDAEDLGSGIIDMNPYSLSDPDFEFDVMDKSDVSIWSESDKDGNTIRDLPGYDPLNPFYWLTGELDVDIINTYIHDDYVARVFPDWSDETTLIVYNKQLNCQEANVVHNFLGSGGWWIFNRGVLNACGRIKTGGIIWGS